MSGDVHVRFSESERVRFPLATHLVMGFEYEQDGREMLAALGQRLAKFGLSLHEGKTRLIEFGKFVSERRERHGERRCETFVFLGFTHYCGRSRDGRFVVKRRTQSRRLSRKLKEIRVNARQRMHRPIRDQHHWLASVLRGHCAYYGLPSNFAMLRTFYDQVQRIWYRTLRKRSRKHRLTWDRFGVLLESFPLPRPRIVGTR